MSADLTEQLAAYLYRKMTPEFVQDVLQCFTDEYGPKKENCKNWKGTGKPCDNLRFCKKMKSSITTAVIGERRKRANEFAQQKGPFYNVLDPILIEEKNEEAV